MVHLGAACPGLYNGKEGAMGTGHLKGEIEKNEETESIANVGMFI